MKLALAVLFWLVVAAAEVAGLIHAFRGHGTTDGVIALALPPWALWRAVEWLWH